MKREIFKNIKKLKGTEYESLHVKYDMTPKERNNNKKLVVEATALENKDKLENFQYWVRGRSSQNVNGPQGQQMVRYKHDKILIDCVFCSPNSLQDKNKYFVDLIAKASDMR